MAAAVSIDQKKKSKHHVDRIPRDGGSGMSASTKKHFEHVKQKMFAFVDLQQTQEADGMHIHLPHSLPPPPPHHRPQPFFVDQKKVLKHRSHHQAPLAPHKQLPHLALATPHVARRGGKPSSNGEGKLPSKVVLF